MQGSKDIYNGSAIRVQWIIFQYNMEEIEYRV